MGGGEKGRMGNGNPSVWVTLFKLIRIYYPLKKL